MAPRFVPEYLLINFDIGKLNQEDEVYYKQLQLDRFNENIIKSEKLKEAINNEEERINHEHRKYDDRHYPCVSHQEPDCDICNYDDEDMIEHGQRTQNTSIAPSVDNEETDSSNSMTTHDVSIDSL